MERFPEKDPSLMNEGELRARLAEVEAERDYYREKLGSTQEELARTQQDFSDLIEDDIYISQRAYRHEQELKQDPLTGLLNKRGLEEEYNKIVYAEKERKEDRLVSELPSGYFLFIDLDNFKIINDKFGHDVGDDVLEKVANNLRGELRDRDIVGRIYGDEFGVILPRKSEEEAEIVGTKMLSAVSQVIDIGGLPWKLTASIGIDEINHGRSFEDALNGADRAMYKAKDAGRNQLRFLETKGQK